MIVQDGHKHKQWVLLIKLVMETSGFNHSRLLINHSLIAIMSRFDNIIHLNNIFLSGL